MSRPALYIHQAALDDLDVVKRLFDANKTALGFVLRPSLIESIQRAELLVAYRDADFVGTVHYHHRRDGQTTLYHIAVNTTSRAAGVGRALVVALQQECILRGMHSIVLKCPQELPANQFYARVGFSHIRTDEGKYRRLNVWHMSISPHPSP